MALPALVFTICHFADFYNFTKVAQLGVVLREFDKCNVVAGDFLGPSGLSLLTRGAHVVEFLNDLGVDMVVPGNHEFDFGDADLMLRIAESNFSWLSTNTMGLRRGGQNVVMLVLRGTVGFIGLTTPETVRDSKPGNKVRFLDICRSAKRAVLRLKRLGARRVVALTHLSRTEDRELACCLGPQLLDVILGGHEHGHIEDTACGVGIRKPEFDAAEFGVLSVFEDSWNWTTVAVPADTPVPEQTLAQLAKVDNATLGYLPRELDFRSARSSQNSGIQFLLEKMLELDTEADAALLLGGGVRLEQNLPAGHSLTKLELASLFPFSSRLIEVELSQTL